MKYDVKAPNGLKWPRITSNKLKQFQLTSKWPHIGLKMASNGLMTSNVLKQTYMASRPQMALNVLQWPLLASNEGIGSLVEYISIIIWLKNVFSKIK